MSEPICATMMCDKPSGDGVVCRDCLAILRGVLQEIPWIVEQLQLVSGKQTRYSSGGDKVTTKGKSYPLPVDFDASDVMDDLGGKLALWTADVARSTNVTALAFYAPQIAAAWLLAHLEDVRVHVAAGDLFDELCQARATSVWMLDRPAEKKYLGECGAMFEDVACTEILWGRDGDRIARCVTCGTEWEVESRKKIIQGVAMESMSDKILSASQAAEILVAYNLANGSNATRLTDRIRKWAEQPKDHNGEPHPDKRPALTQKMLVGIGGRLRPGYRFGDIIDLMNRRKAG